MKEYGTLSTMMYQKTKPAGYSLDGDIEYYGKHLKDLKGKILEAGVGTGRMMIPLLKQGLNVEGLDRSKEMLKQCRLNLAEENLQGTLYEGDLTKLDLPTKYEAIIMPTGSFCLLPQKEVEKVLAGFYRQLQLGGKVMIDLEWPTSFAVNSVSTSEIILDKERSILFTSIAQSMDWLQQKTCAMNRYELFENGKLLQTEVGDFTMYWYGLKEFYFLLEKAGFSEISATRGYEKNKEIPLMTFFATK